MIDQTGFSQLQEFLVAVFGPIAYYLLVLFVAGLVALVMLVITLGLLRRMFNP